MSLYDAPAMKVTVLASVISVVLTGCMVGPSYKKPELSLPKQFDQAPVGQETLNSENALWSAFNDPALNALIARAQQENKTVVQATARLQETRALRGLYFYSWFPTITAAASEEKSRASNRDPFIPSGTGTKGTYRAGFDASWEIDLFGGTRQQKNAITSESMASAYQLKGAQLSVSAEVAQAYFALRGAQQRRVIQKQNIENLQQTERVLAARLKEGRGSALEVAQNRTVILQVEAQLPIIDAEIVRQEQRLSVLTAQSVAALRETLQLSKSMPTLPALQAIGTPEQWVRRRPDILAAEQQFAAANARVGEKVSDYFPKLNLFGSFGWTAQGFGDLGNSSAERWSYGPSLSWNFLNAGRVRQNVKAAEARADAAAAAYQQTVLLALEDTENALAQYRATNQSVQQLQQAAEQSRKARDLARLRYETGASDFLTLLDAERTLLAVEDAGVQAAIAHASSLALTYKALGGDFAEVVR